MSDIKYHMIVNTIFDIVRVVYITLWEQETWGSKTPLKWTLLSNLRLVSQTMSIFFSEGC